MSPVARATRAGWARSVETASLQRRPALEDDAVRRWTALASTAQRMALVREIVATRAPELTLAYRNVVAVVAGYRTRRNAGGAEELLPEPCVIFITRKKWQPGDAGDPGQRLPARLLTFGPGAAQGRGRSPARCVFAVPTDVQLAARHAGARAQAGAAVRMADEVAAFALPGTLTCGVRLQGAAAAESHFVLSAMHVLSPVPRQTDARGGADFAALLPPQVVRGVSARWGGHLDGNSGDGFDAQLAVLTNRAWFNAALAPLRLSTRMSFVPAPDLFDELAPRTSFRIVVHDGQPNAAPGPRAEVRAQFSKVVGREWVIFYDMRIGNNAAPAGIVHPELLLLSVHPDCPPPASGDSGSAVVCDNDDGSVTLVGMYIARGPQGAERDAYVLPAWQLFDPANWRQLPAGTTALRPSFKLP
jgi:hypothetical protein